MPNALAASGAQPPKPTKAAPIYNSRFFNGLYTNRSPLRDARTTRTQEKFYGPDGDAIIAGANVEITNQLTLSRRPGNPLYDSTNTWTNLLSYDAFRLSKPLSDIFGATIEEILVMVSEGPGVGQHGAPSNASLSAEDSDFVLQPGDPGSTPGTVWSYRSPSAAQSFGMQVGNQWYFGNGVDNKKWNQSLFVRSAESDSQPLPLNTYPFMTTFLIDGNSNMQQLIGAIADSSTDPQTTVTNITISEVAISENVITLTVSGAPYSTVGDDGYPQVGSQVMIWGQGAQFEVDNTTSTVGALAFLQGATLTLTEIWSSTTITANFVYKSGATLAPTAVTGTAVVQLESGGPTLANGVPNPNPELLLGASVPTWGTTVPSSVNNFQGSLTFDGQAIWVNRGTTVQNWGLAAPDEEISVSTFGASAGNWQPNTYYSPASVIFDSAGRLWQIQVAGKTGAAFNPPTSSLVYQKKIDIYTIETFGTGAWTDYKVIFGTESLPAGLTTNDTFTVSRLRTANAQPLLGQTFIVDSIANGSVAAGCTKLITCHYIPSTGANDTDSLPAWGDAGYATLTKIAGSAATTYSSGAETWVLIQKAAPTQGTWIASTHFYEDDYIVSNGSLWQLYKGVTPFIHSYPPIPGVNNCPTFSTNYAAPTTPITGYIYDQGDEIDGKTLADWNGTFAVFYPGIAPSATVNPPSLWAQTGADQTQPVGQLPNNWNTGTGGSHDIFLYPVSGNGTIDGSPTDGNFTASDSWSIIFGIYIPAPGTYSFSIAHKDGSYICFAQGSPSGPTPGSGGAFQPFGPSPVMDQPISGMVGCNSAVYNGAQHQGNPPASGVYTENVTFTFPAAGVFVGEIGQAIWNGPGAEGGREAMLLTNNGSWTQPAVSSSAQAQNIAVGQDLSWSQQPVWTGAGTLPTTGQSYTPAPATQALPFAGEIVFGGQAIEIQSGLYTWMNLGPVSAFAVGSFLPDTFYTTPGFEVVVDGNLFAPYGTGSSSTSIPSTNFKNASTVGSLAQDNGNLWWMNIGQAPSAAATPGKISAVSATGFIYGIALVNTLDSTVSNLSPTNEVNGAGINVINGNIIFGPGEGLDLNTIDPQADYVAIFRTTDGGTLELLVPSNGNTNWTVPLSQYLNYGYVDGTPDTQLDDLVQAAVAGENTPPAPGAVNLTYHLNRLWYSIGNTVWYTSGPLAPCGNGINGAAVGNQDSVVSRVSRLFPMVQGLLVFTLSDVLLIQNSGGSILQAVPFAPGVGLSSYNAFDKNGTIIGMVTTDHQFILFDPANGVDHAGHPIANLFRLDNGEPGTDWNPAQAYVARYVNGEDMGWFVADGTNGWYRLVENPAPEQGLSWSPFANILPDGQGCGAIKAVEVTPGQHLLLSGPRIGANSSGQTNARDLLASTDGGTTETDGTTYPAWAVFGSYVCAQPGQVANIYFVTTDSVKIGTPLIIGLYLGEALPYFTGSPQIVKRWELDPPNIQESKSLYGQRFYVSEDHEECASLRHMQIQIQWAPEAAVNELLSFTIYGSFAGES
jgi:hypothetical protein